MRRILIKCSLVVGLLVISTMYAIAQNHDPVFIFNFEAVYNTQTNDMDVFEKEVSVLVRDNEKSKKKGEKNLLIVNINKNVKLDCPLRSDYLEYFVDFSQERNDLSFVSRNEKHKCIYTFSSVDDSVVLFIYDTTNEKLFGLIANDETINNRNLNTFNRMLNRTKTHSFVTFTVRDSK